MCDDGVNLHSHYASFVLYLFRWCSSGQTGPVNEVAGDPQCQGIGWVLFLAFCMLAAGVSSWGRGVTVVFPPTIPATRRPGVLDLVQQQFSSGLVCEE